MVRRDLVQKIRISQCKRNCCCSTKFIGTYYVFLGTFYLRSIIKLSLPHAQRTDALSAQESCMGLWCTCDHERTVTYLYLEHRLLYLDSMANVACHLPLARRSPRLD